MLSHIYTVLERFHAGYFRITLSLAAQSLLLKTAINIPNGSTYVNDASSKYPLHHFIIRIHPRPSVILAALWFLTLVILTSVSLIYLLRCVFRFELVKAEFLNRVGVNYLFTPWISWLLLLQSAPFVKSGALPCHILWWVFTVPIIALDVKIYGQWFIKGKRLLSKMANPTSQLSVMANLVASWGAAQYAWKESAICLFALGMAHYVVLFVTLYQRLSGGELLPPMLRPGFLLLFAAPSVASLALESIVEGFGVGSKMLYFISLFFFASLVCRPMLFKRSMEKFNVALWAYSFTLTFLAIACIEHGREVNGDVPHALMFILSILSVLVSLILAILTLVYSKTLFPNDDPVMADLVEPRRRQCDRILA